MLRLRFFTFAAAILLAAEAPAAESTRHLCFSRDGGVWIANLDGSGAHKIVTGSDPAISPDGARIAYVDPLPQGPRARVIALEGGEARDVGDASSYCRPVWSSINGRGSDQPSWKVFKGPRSKFRRSIL